jgi:hypothetical protein
MNHPCDALSKGSLVHFGLSDPWTILVSSIPATYGFSNLGRYLAKMAYCCCCCLFPSDRRDMGFDKLDDAYSPRQVDNPNHFQHLSCRRPQVPLEPTTIRHHHWKLRDSRRNPDMIHDADQSVNPRNYLACVPKNRFYGTDCSLPTPL